MKTLLLTTFVFCSFSLFSQEYNTLNPNQVKTGMHSNGSMFMDQNFQNAGFQVPYTGNGSPAALFAGGIWMGGTDPAGNLKVSSITYPNPSFGADDYTAGPYNASDFTFDFEQVWKVTIDEINAHIADFADGSIDDTPADNILEWPASGNPNFSETFPTQQMASFFDENGDGIYNAYDGDYPIIIWPNGNVIPTEMLYTVYYNEDSANSNSNPTNIEVHSLMYGFGSDTDEVIDNSIFNQLTIINRGVEDLQNFRLGYWIDPDLGCHLDDYAGCDPDRNAMFVYNGDQEDGDNGTSCNFGIPTYGDMPPVVTMTFLNRSFSDFMVYYNGGVNNPNPPTTDPQTADEIFRLLSGRWKDGTALTIGGDGYNQGSSDASDFAFFDPPSDPDGWSMYAQGLPFNDFRTLSTISRGLLEPGEVITLDVVITSTNKDGFNHIELVDEALNDVDYIQSLFNSGVISSTKQIAQSKPASLNPNPNNGSFTLEAATSFDRYSITDVFGHVIESGVINGALFNFRLTPNVYFMHLYSQDNAQQETVKFVVVE